MSKKIGAVNYMECSAVTQAGVKEVIHAGVSAGLSNKSFQGKKKKKSKWNFFKR